MEKPDYDRKWLVREIARRTRSNIGDVDHILKTFADIMHEIVADKKSLMVRKMFKLYVKEIASHKGWDAVRNQSLNIDSSSRVVLKASSTLTKSFK